MMMEEQLERTKEEIREMDRVKEKVQGFLEQLEVEGSNTGRTGPVASSASTKRREIMGEEDEVIEEAKSMWNLLDEIDEN